MNQSHEQPSTRNRTTKGGGAPVGLELKELRVSNKVMVAIVTCLGTFLTGILAIITLLLRGS